MDQNRILCALEIYDITARTRMLVREFDTHIEAPNWTPDGANLVYNSGGLIYRYNFASTHIELIETGSCNQCNNDHVISADGQWLAISSGTDAVPASRIWFLPFSGGEPRLVTKSAPSYLHGWSPDGSTFAYCAERGGEYDIYTISREPNAPEVRLTNTLGLNDGPEYSPDGRYIWFNSVRTGLMQIWRMHKDGTGQQQMSFDEDRNSWFPHISPDGKHVVYVAYRKGDVAPGDHPPGKHVELRMMSSEGSEATTLTTLYGGQGTLNVNSWSPDSQRFAFVSYRLPNTP